MSPSQEVHLSHTSFRKRARQEYQRLLQAKRAKLVAGVRGELQDNRKHIEQLLADKVGVVGA